MPTTPARPITVIVVEDDPYARGAIVALLSDHPDQITVTHECSGEEEAFAAAVEDTPDVMLIDLRLRGNSRGGIQLLDRLREASVKSQSMILTADNPNGVTLADAVTAGAHGFYRKSTLPGNLLAPTLIRICQGDVVIEPELMDAVKRGLNINASSSQDDPPPHLTAREKRVLSLINRQFTTHEIADHLGLGDTTVKSHLTAVRTKFGGKMNSHQAALYAALLGLL